MSQGGSEEPIHHHDTRSKARFDGIGPSNWDNYDDDDVDFDLVLGLVPVLTGRVETIQVEEEELIVHELEKIGEGEDAGDEFVDAIQGNED